MDALSQPHESRPRSPQRLLVDWVIALFLCVVALGYVLIGGFGILFFLYSIFWNAIGALVISIPFILLSTLLFIEFFSDKARRWLCITNHVLAAILVAFAIYIVIAASHSQSGFAVYLAIWLCAFAAGPLAYLIHSPVYWISKRCK